MGSTDITQCGIPPFRALFRSLIIVDLIFYIKVMHFVFFILFFFYMYFVFLYLNPLHLYISLGTNFHSVVIG